MKFTPTSIMTPRGLVDLTAVDRVLGGHAVELTPAESSYALTRLVRSLDETPAPSSTGQLRDRGSERAPNAQWDRRIQLAADGFGTDARRMADRISTHRRRYGDALPQKIGKPGPPRG